VTDLPEFSVSDRYVTPTGERTEQGTGWFGDPSLDGMLNQGGRERRRPCRSELFERTGDQVQQRCRFRIGQCLAE
jgi:hypothetical protein